MTDRQKLNNIVSLLAFFFLFFRGNVLARRRRAAALQLHVCARVRQRVCVCA